MKPDLFFASLRSRKSGVFGTSLSQAQVDGTEAILDECIRQNADLGQAAYILGTGYGETGGRMKALRENLNYSAAQIAKHFAAHRRQGKTPAQLSRNPVLLGNTVYGGEWGKKHLGNTLPNDGYDLRGAGMGQWTGRANLTKLGIDAGLDLVANPALLDDLKTNARLLVTWMLKGGATGLRLDRFVKGGKRDYHGARRVWGGVDAAKYVVYAKAFEAALIAGGYDATSAPTRPTTPPRPPSAPQRPAPAKKGFLARLLDRLLSRVFPNIPGGGPS